LSSGTPPAGHEVLDHPILKELAAKYGKTTANVVLRWHLELGGSLVCKSVTPSRIIENYNIWDFALSKEDLVALSDLNIGWRHLIWAETSMHSDYPYKEELPFNYKTDKPGKGSTAGAK